MKVNTLLSGVNPVVIVLGILATLLVYAVLTRKRVPILNTDRSALLGFIVIGMAICSQIGIGRVSASGAWAHPISIVGYLLGAAIVLTGLAALFGKPIPPLTSYHQSFQAVVVIAVIKIGLTTIHRLFL